MIGSTIAKMSYAEMMEKYISATDPFFNQEAWNAMKEDITLEYLLQRNTQGPFKDTNLLMMLASLVEGAVPGPFLEIFEKFKDKILYKEFLYQSSKESPNILTRLASAPGNEGCVEPFSKVFSHYVREIDVADLVEKTSNSPSVLWHLAWRASIDETEQDKAFLAVWKEFHMAIPLAKLIENQGEEEQVSIIWHLAIAYYCYDTESLLVVWKKFEKEMPLTALTAIPVNPQNPYANISALWHITQVAVESNKSDLLFSIWERFKKEMSVEAWLAYSDHWPETLSDNNPSPYCGKTALGLLATSINPNFKRIATEILQQLPGLIPYTQCYDLALLSQGTGKLLQARSEFHSALEAFKIHRTSEAEKAAQVKAENAEEAGYFNAYFELANYFTSQHDLSKQIRELNAVSSKSWHFDSIQEDLAVSMLDALKEVSSAHLKQVYIREALQYALGAAPQKREALLQKVAACSILGVDSDIEKRLIPLDLAEVMTKQPAAWCWNRIEEIRRTVQLKAEITELKRQSAAPSVDANLLGSAAQPVLQFSTSAAVSVLTQERSSTEDSAKRPRH